MPGLDRLFSTVENYQNMTLQYLTVSTRVQSSLLGPLPRWQPTATPSGPRGNASDQYFSSFWQYR